ncbi:MAG: phosphoribosyltransferase family protein [Bacteroidota bacterium]
MITNDSTILNHRQIQQKTRRIAYQVLEDHLNEEKIVLAGIANSGYAFAQELKEVLNEISDLIIIDCEVEINKKNPIEAVKTSLQPSDYKELSIVLVDDVLNSGATLIYGVKHFLEVPVKQIKTAVLVDRSHKKFPVKADYKGLSLSTSLSETVQVSFGEKHQVELF